MESERLSSGSHKSSPSIVKARTSGTVIITDKDHDTRADLPGAQLPAKRQLRFLREFAADWRGQQMKACLFVDDLLQPTDQPSRPPTTGELDKDLDSNGWPQSGSAGRALQELRRGFISSTSRWRSAPGERPSTASTSRRRRLVPVLAGDRPYPHWNPKLSTPDTARWPPVQPAIYRHHEDGFHNRLTIHAVANPVDDPRPGSVSRTGRAPPQHWLNIVRFNKAARTIRPGCHAMPIPAVVASTPAGQSRSIRPTTGGRRAVARCQLQDPWDVRCRRQVKRVEACEVVYTPAHQGARISTENLPLAATPSTLVNWAPPV
jgi:hypothetical protein